jgi:hypothetical protein
MKERDEATVRHRYGACSQQPNESDTSFKERMVNLYYQMEAAGQHLPTPVQLAQDFLIRLDQERHGALTEDILNCAARGAPFEPTTIDAALNYVTNYHGDGPAVSLKSGPVNAVAPTETILATAKTNRNAKKSSSEDTFRLPPRPCHINNCNQMHYENDHERYLKLMESRGKSKKDTVAVVHDDVVLFTRCVASSSEDEDYSTHSTVPPPATTPQKKKGTRRNRRHGSPKPLISTAGSHFHRILY